MSNKIARAGTAGTCNHMTLSPKLVIMHASIADLGRLLMQAFACYMLAYVSSFQTRQGCTHVSLTYNFAMFSYLITFHANISS